MLVAPLALAAALVMGWGIMQGVDSAQAAVGDRSAWTQSFDHDVPLGSVTAGGVFPGYSSVWAYPDGTRTTHGGKYSPSTVNAVEDGALTWHVQPGGVGSSVTIGPSAVGGEWSVRMRTESIAGIHIADMRWPDDDVWPGTDGSGGEIDFPEEDTTAPLPYAAVVGNAGELHDGAQLFNPVSRPRVPAAWTGWHTYTTQVDPGKSVVLYQDGIEVARVTENVPRTAIHEQFQVEPLQAGVGATGTVQVSAVAYSPQLDLSTLTAAGGTAASGAATPGVSATATAAAPTAAAPSDDASPSPTPTSEPSGTASAGGALPSASASASQPSPTAPSPTVIPPLVIPPSVAPSADPSELDTSATSVLDPSTWLPTASASSADAGRAADAACRTSTVDRTSGVPTVTAQPGCDTSGAITQAPSSGRAYGYFEVTLFAPSPDHVRVDLVASDPAGPSFGVLDGTTGGQPCFTVSTSAGGRWCGTVGPVSAGVHTYGALVTSSGVQFFVDHAPVGRWQGDVPDVPRVLRIGIDGAVGGSVAVERALVVPLRG